MRQTTTVFVSAESCIEHESDYSFFIVAPEDGYRRGVLNFFPEHSSEMDLSALLLVSSRGQSLP
jgi:hypothetical protein